MTAETDEWFWKTREGSEGSATVVRISRSSSVEGVEVLIRDPGEYLVVPAPGALRRGSVNVDDRSSEVALQVQYRALHG